MKKYNFIIIILFIILTFVFKVDNVTASLPLIGKTIVIDPGHGGVDPGAVVGEILEKDLNLSISIKIEEELIKLGATVLLTREGDYDLSSPNVTWRKQSDFDNRISFINSSNSDIYLSIHMNYLNDASYGGTQIFYSDDIALAEVIQENINEEFGFNRTVKKIPTSTYMYSKLEIPGVLIECGFLSNYNDRENFQNEEYQEKFAKIVAKSVSDFFY